MRISTTALFFTGAFLLCTAITAFALPTVTISNIKHACGGNANGSFQVNITGASGGALNKPLVIHIFGPPGFSDPAFSIPVPPGGSYTYPVSGALGDNTSSYIVVVTDGTGNKSATADINDFTVTLDTSTNNTNPSCAPSNGSISVLLDGSGGATIQFSWTGPNGFTSSSQNITGLTGGDYDLSYSDGTTTCSIPTVHITDPAAADFTISGPTSVCEGNGVSIAVSTTTAGYTYDVVRQDNVVVASQAGTGSGISIAIPAAMLPVGAYTFHVEAKQGTCTPKLNASPDVSVTVNPTPDYTTSPPSTACSSAATLVNLTSFKASGTNATSFLVTAVSFGTMTAGTGANGTAPYTINAGDLADDQWKNVSNAPQPVTYSITPRIGTCDGAPFTVTVNINPQPDFNPESASVCSAQITGVDLDAGKKGTSVAATTYNVGPVNPNGLTALVGPTTGNGLANTAIANDKWVNTTNASVAVTYTVVPVSTNGCKGDPFTVTVNVTPQPDYNDLINSTGVCSQAPIGADLTGLQKNLAATSFNVTAINPHGATAAGGAIGTPSYSISATDLMDDQWKNVTTVPVLVDYTIQPVIGSCVGNPFTVSVKILPEPDYTTGSTSTVCSNIVIGVDLQTFAKGTSVIADSYVITQINPDPLLTPKGVNLSLPRTGNRSEVTNDTWENVQATSLNVVYTVTPKSGTCDGAPFSFTVQIKPEPKINDASLPGGICSGDALGIDLSVLPSSGIAADAWTIVFIDAVNLTPSVGPASGTGANLISGDKWINNTSGTLPVVYHVAPSANGCAGAQFAITIPIVPLPSYHDYNDASGGICATPLGIDLDSFVNSGSPLATTFKITAISSTGLTSVVAPPANPITHLDLQNNVWSNVNATALPVDYTIVPTNGSCDGTPFHVVFMIKPQPEYAPATQDLCSSIAISYDLNATKSGTSSTATSFDIAVGADPELTNTSGAPAGGTTTNNILTDKWQNITAVDHFVTYTVTPSTNGCAGAPFTVKFTIHPEPQYNNKTLPDICSDDLIGLDLESLKTGSGISATVFNYSVPSNPNLTPDAGQSLTGSGDNMVISTHKWKNITSAAIPLTYTIQPQAAGGCLGVSFTVTVNVTPQPSYSGTTVNNICGNSPTGVNLATLINSNSVVADSFQLTSLTLPGMTAGSTVVTSGVVVPGDLTDDTFRNVSGITQQATYTLRPVKGTCVGDPFIVIVNILPQPDYNPTSSKPVCSREAVNVDLSLLDTGNSIPADSYTITITYDNTQLTSVGTALTQGPGQDKNSILGHKFQNLTNTSQQVTYSVVPVGNGCAGDPFVLTVDVKPEPVGADDAVTVCTSTAVNYNLQNNITLFGNGIPAVSFSWMAADNTNVTNESTSPQSTNIIGDNIINNTTTSQDVTYTITPSNGTCAGNPFTVVVTVSPKPVLVAGQTATVCSGIPINYEILLNPANMPAGTTFTWPAPVMSDGSIQGNAQTTPLPMGVAGTKHILDALTNTTSTPITAIYTVTPSLNGLCAGTPVDIVFTINQGFIANAGNDQAICSDAGPYTLVGSSVSGAAQKGSWSFASNPGGNGTITPAGTLLADPSTATFASTVPGDYVLQLTTELDVSGVCPQGTDVVTVTVTDKPVITPGQTALVCANDPVAYEIKMTPANLPLNTVFNWADPDGPTGATNASAGVNIPMGTPGTKHINDVLRNETNGNLTVTYQITPSVGLCVGTQEDIVVTVKPAPSVVFGQTKTICSGDRVDYEILLNPANTPAGTTFSWPDPDGSASGRSKLNVPADPAGTLHITDTLYNGSGAVDTVVYSVIARGTNGCIAITRDVKIVINSGAIAEAGNAQVTCSNGTATLAGSSVGGLATQGTWSIVNGPAGGDGVITNGTNTSTPNAATFKASISGSYTLQLTTDDPSGSCGPVTDNVVITVKPVGDPSCTGGSGTCSTVAIAPIPTPATCNNSDGSVFFDIVPAVPVSGDVSITIDGTGSTVLPSPRTNINNFTFDVLAPGTYSYNIIYGDPGCTKTGVFSIDRSGTVGTATVSNLIDPICFEGTGTATIDVPGETGNILVWSENGVDFHNFVVGNPVTGLPGGLIAIMRSGDPCAAGVMVNFNMPPEIPVTITATSASCSNDDGTIEVSNSNKGNTPYLFELNGVSTNLPADSVIRGLSADVYDLVVKDTKGCTKTFDTIVITQVVGPASLDTLFVKTSISVPDLPSGSALVGVKPSGLEPYETRLELTTPLFASQQYLSDWQDVPLDPQDLKFEQSYTNIYAGVYTLGLRDAGGCTKNYLITIGVNTDLFVPNIFTPNKDGSNEVFYIRNLPSSDAKLLITNRWGKEVYKSSSYQNNWDGGDTVDGMYYYNLVVSGQKFTGWVEILRGQ